MPGRIQGKGTKFRGNLYCERDLQQHALIYFQMLNLKFH